MNEQVKILCVDDEKNVLRALRRLFLDEDYVIFTAGSGEEGLEILRAEGEVPIVMSDYRMPGMNGVDFLRGVCRNWPDTVRIVLSGYADTASVVEAVNDGEIYKFIPKPWNDDELRITIQKAVERYHLKKTNLQLMEELKISNEKLRKVNETLEVVVKKALNAAFQWQDRSIYQHVLRFLPRGVIGIDHQGDIVHCNETARELLGETETNILGNPWSAVLPEMFHPFMAKLLEQGVLSESCRIGEQRGWIKGNRVQLGPQEGLVLGFDWGETGHE
jgi:two-component system NtrC family sensor kinase